MAIVLEVHSPALAIALANVTIAEVELEQAQYIATYTEVDKTHARDVYAAVCTEYRTTLDILTSEVEMLEDFNILAVKRDVDEYYQKFSDMLTQSAIILDSTIHSTSIINTAINKIAVLYKGTCKLSGIRHNELILAETEVTSAILNNTCTQQLIDNVHRIKQDITDLMNYIGQRDKYKNKLYNIKLEISKQIDNHPSMIALTAKLSHARNSMFRICAIYTGENITNRVFNAQLKLNAARSAVVTIYSNLLKT